MHKFAGGRTPTLVTPTTSEASPPSRTSPSANLCLLFSRLRRLYWSDFSLLFFFWFVLSSAFQICIWNEGEGENVLYRGNSNSSAFYNFCMQKSSCKSSLFGLILAPLSRSIYLRPQGIDEMSRNGKKRKEERMRPKKREVLELPSTEIVKSWGVGEAVPAKTTFRSIFVFKLISYNNFF